MHKLSALLIPVFFVVMTLSGGHAMAAKWKDGEEVSVKWKGEWYHGVVLKKKGDKYRVHYKGWAASWDEDVAKSRIRKLPKFNVGFTAEVDWKGSWYINGEVKNRLSW